MTFGILHIDGAGEDSPDIDSLDLLYDELDRADEEHFDVSVVHDETGWSLTAYPSGRLVFEHLDSGGERHMIPVPKDHVIKLWRLLAAGQIDAILDEPWKLGYGV